MKTKREQFAPLRTTPPNRSAIRALPERDRFWAYVEKTLTCWLWNGAIEGWGYGHFKAAAPRGMVRAHCYSWELENGPIPKGEMLCHSCDNRRCVRPSHLFLGTHQTNADDASQKGRLSRRLDAHKAAAIFRSVRSGASMRDIAAEHGIGKTTVFDVARRHIWRSATEGL